MSNLGTQVSELKWKLNRIKDSQKKEDVIEKTANISSQLTRLSELLEDQIQFFDAINFINHCYENTGQHDEIFKNNIEYHAQLGTLTFNKKLSTRLETLILKFDIFREEWETLGYEVQQKESYTNVREFLSLLVKNLKENNTLHWGCWLRMLEAEIKIEDEFLDKQKHNPSQKATYDAFNQKLSLFKTKVNERDKSNQLAQEIYNLASELTSIKANFDLSDFPEDVEKFFKSVDSKYETATLEYLTPEVLEWITDHNYLNNFKVERKH